MDLGSPLEEKKADIDFRQFAIFFLGKIFTLASARAAFHFLNGGSHIDVPFLPAGTLAIYFVLNFYFWRKVKRDESEGVNSNLILYNILATILELALLCQLPLKPSSSGMISAVLAILAWFGVAFIEAKKG